MLKKLLQLSIVIIILIIVPIINAGETTKKDDEIEKKIEQMTLAEKIEFIGGYKSFNIRGIERLGIPEVRMADGPVGVRNYGKSTSYPAGINLAASFDRKLARKVGQAIGSEARAKNVHIMLGPGMNIYRLPLNGRNFEYLGEDPYLAGQMAKEYILGMQNQGVMATAKHFVANNQEFDRHNVSSDMDERTLHEIYLPAFKESVIGGKVACIMTGYNLVNGIHASQNNYLNNEILKSQWDFDGFVMSDWVSTYDGIECANGGLDLEMPSGKMMSKETLIPAIEDGLVDVSVIDDKIRRILTMYKRFNLFENPDISKNYELDKEFVQKVALDAARGGIVLLKNETDYLPINKSKIKSIAVIGPNANPVISGGGGSSFVEPLHPLSLYKAVKKIAGNEIDVKFEKGLFTGVPFPENLFDDFNFYVYKNGEKVKGVNAVFFKKKNLSGKIINKSVLTKLDLTDSEMWDLDGVPETDYSARFSCYFTPEESGFYSIGAKGDDGYRIIIDGVTVVDMWRDQGPTPAKYDSFLNGGQEYKVEVEYYQSGGGAVIKLGAAKVTMDLKPESYISKALKVAKNSDLVILSLGFDGSKESESFDRTFEMPYDQSNFINEIAKVNKNIVVVLNSGGNVEMESWIKNVKALLMAWYPGQEGNLAAAEILFGITNPSGKLPASFAYDIKDNPTFINYFDDDGDNKVYYKEGLFLGYRYWDNADKKPRFPFGYGLSYTTFDIKNLKTDKMRYKIGEKVLVSVDIKNIGKMAGKNTLQLYVGDKKSSLIRPIKELKDFDKIFLNRGEEKTVHFELNKAAFSFYDPSIHNWKIEPGEFTIFVGNSSQDIRQTVQIEME